MRETEKSAPENDANAGFVDADRREAEAPPSYRLLETGEIIQEGDQWQRGSTGQWLPAGDSIGCEVRGALPFRRPITGGAGLHEAAACDQSGPLVSETLERVLEPNEEIGSGDYVKRDYGAGELDRVMVKTQLVEQKASNVGKPMYRRVTRVHRAPAPPALSAILAAAETRHWDNDSCFHLLSGLNHSFCESPRCSHVDDGHPFVSLAALLRSVAEMAVEQVRGDWSANVEDIRRQRDEARERLGKCAEVFDCKPSEVVDRVKALRAESMTPPTTAAARPSEQAVRDDANGNPVFRPALAYRPPALSEPQTADDLAAAEDDEPTLPGILPRIEKFEECGLLLAAGGIALTLALGRNPFTR